MLPIPLADLLPSQSLPPPQVKSFLDAPLHPIPDPREAASLILRYFFRAREGYEKQIIFTSDGDQKEVTSFIRTKVPLLSEVARVLGLTKRELTLMAKAFPDTIGRAVEAAMDVADEYIVHNTLEGLYHPAAAALIAPNISRIVSKQLIKVEDTQKVSALLLSLIHI